MNDRELRFLVVALWGVSVAIVYLLVFLREWKAFLRHHDSRGRRDLLASFARFLTAIAACLAILGVLAGDYVVGLRGALTALALGAFLGAGLVELTDRRPEH